MTLGEGAAAGKALISSENCGAAHHLIEQGQNGFRVTTGDAVALAKAMLTYSIDRELAQRHGCRSKEIVMHCSPKHNVERLLLGIEQFQAGVAPEESPALRAAA
jgi:glycosyltransferase involved in cell wall biosynthesis